MRKEFRVANHDMPAFFAIVNVFVLILVNSTKLQKIFYNAKY